MTDFSGHRDPSFWESHEGRLGIKGDCSVIEPAFVPGKRYVLLLGIAPDLKQYEQLADADDRWLQFVESSLSAAK